MRTCPSPTCDAVTIVVLRVVAHSLHILQTLVSRTLLSSPTHLHLCRSWYSPLMKHVLHSSLFSSSISICEQKLKYWAAKRKIQSSDNPIHNHLRYTMLYIRSHWIPILFVVKTTLVHQLPTLRAMCAFLFYRDGVFSYLPCSWIVQERFEPRISFITCPNNIWQPFFRSLEKLLCVDYCCFHNEPLNYIGTITNNFNNGYTMYHTETVYRYIDFIACCKLCTSVSYVMQGTNASNCIHV